MAFELDCYDFIATKNSFAMLRLGIDAQNKGRPAEAFERYTKAQKLVISMQMHFYQLFMVMV